MDPVALRDLRFECIRDCLQNGPLSYTPQNCPAEKLDVAREMVRSGLVSGHVGGSASHLESVRFFRVLEPGKAFVQSQKDAAQIAFAEMPDARLKSEFLRFPPLHPFREAASAELWKRVQDKPLIPVTAAKSKISAALRMSGLYSSAFALLAFTALFLLVQNHEAHSELKWESRQVKHLTREMAKMESSEWKLKERSELMAQHVLAIDHDLARIEPGTVSGLFP